MKKTQQVDPELEELRKLSEALSAHKNLLAERERFLALSSAINSEVESFAESGDLLDIKAVSAVAAKQLQATLVAKRIESLGTKLDQSEAELAAVTATVGRLLLGDLNQIKNGAIESVAQSMKPHFDDYQDCRRKAAQSNTTRDINMRIFTFESEAKTEEPVALAEQYLSTAPHISDELNKVRDSLGGTIPSASELAAV